VIGRRIEIGALIALAFFLPLYEAPKSIFWALYVLAWIINRVRARDFGGRWDSWDTLICVWIASGFIVAGFAGLQGSEWHAALDIVRMGTVLWMLKRSRLGNKDRYAILAGLVASALLGLVMGYAALWSGANRYLQLNSVGNVNHSAIYLAIMLGLCAGWFFSGKRAALAGASAALVLVSVFVTTSRGAIAMALLMVLLLALAWTARSRIPLYIALSAVVGATIFAVLIDAEVVEKHEGNVHSGQVLGRRDQAWALAFATWRQHPWFGVGMDNFARTNPPNHPDPFVHAHSLYLNTLAERGMLGAAPVALLLIAWIVALLRRRPAARDSDHDWIVWSAAAGAWTITTGVGLVNTTLHHEHGILAMLLLGLWLSATSSGRSSAPSRPPPGGG